MKEFGACSSTRSRARRPRLPRPRLAPRRPGFWPSVSAARGPSELAIAVAYLSGELPQGSVGVGWASLGDLPDPAEPPPTLELAEVDAAVSRIAGATGKGSQAIRRAELAGLFERATEIEQRFLTSLFLGELRQGALEGVMVDAVAKAAGLAPAAVRRAAMLTGNLGEIAEAAMTGGDDRSLRRSPGRSSASEADARAAGRRPRKRHRAAYGPRRWSGRSTALASRCTGSEVTCVRSPGASRT